MTRNIEPRFAETTLGSDPELAIYGPKGKFIPAEKFIPGTKEEPHKVDCGAVQVDGFAAEFNIDPASSYEEWEDNHTTVIRQLEEMIPSDHKLVAKPTVSISKETWEEVSEETKTLGCSPDFNAWTGDVNPPPLIPPDMRIAAFGGHVHFGFTEGAEIDDEDYVEASLSLARQLDWYLGGWSVKHDSNTMRRKLYGKAGSMRFKPYGMEYRVLSNFWVLSPTMRRQVWNRSQQAMRLMSKRGYNYGDLKDPRLRQASAQLIKAIEEGKFDPIFKKQYHFPLTEKGNF